MLITIHFTIGMLVIGIFICMCMLARALFSVHRELRAPRFCTLFLVVVMCVRDMNTRLLTNYEVSCISSKRWNSDLSSKKKNDKEAVVCFAHLPGIAGHSVWYWLAIFLYHLDWSPYTVMLEVEVAWEDDVTTLNTTYTVTPWGGGGGRCYRIEHNYVRKHNNAYLVVYHI